MAEKTTEMAARFGIKITPQTLADYFQALKNSQIQLNGRAYLELNGFQIFTEHTVCQKGMLYICRPENLPAARFCAEGAVYAILGQPDRMQMNPDSVYLWADFPGSFFDFINEIQALWERYCSLRERMLEIAAGSGSLEDVCALAVKHFSNPVFIHDEYFNILASEGYTADSFHFDYNQNTDSFTESIDLINQFRTDKNYKETLQTSGGQLYSSEVSESDALYANLWEHGLYRGRIVVSQQDSLFCVSQKEELAAFAALALEIIERSNTRSDRERQQLRAMFGELAAGSQIDEKQLEDSIRKLGWDISDRYVAGRIAASDEEITRLSVKSICDDIERKISGIFTLPAEKGIGFLLNLSIFQEGMENFRAKMSYIIREGLLKAGVSNPFSFLPGCAPYFRQAAAALKYGALYRPTDWYNEFRTYMIPCWLREGAQTFGLERMAAPAIAVLREYDREHDACLCQTLETYLDCERSSTLTAQVLKIHRSTLIYRLKRITELTGLNLDDKDTRFYLNLSFYGEKYWL